MTNEEIERAPEVARIGKHLAAAGRELVKLQERSGRRLGFFGEDGTIQVIDEERDDYLSSNRGSGGRGRTVSDGGSIVGQYGRAGGASWSGGGF